MDSRRIRIIKLPGLPEVLRRGEGAARIIDVTSKPPTTNSRRRSEPAASPPPANFYSSQPSDYHHHQLHHHQPPPSQTKNLPHNQVNLSRTCTPNILYPNNNKDTGPVQQPTQRRAVSLSPKPVASDTNLVLNQDVLQKIDYISKKLDTFLKIVFEQSTSSNSSTAACKPSTPPAPTPPQPASRPQYYHPPPTAHYQPKPHHMQPHIADPPQPQIRRYKPQHQQRFSTQIQPQTFHHQYFQHSEQTRHRQAPLPAQQTLPPKPNRSTTRPPRNEIEIEDCLADISFASREYMCRNNLDLI